MTGNVIGTGSVIMKESVEESWIQKCESVCEDWTSAELWKEGWMRLLHMLGRGRSWTDARCVSTAPHAMDVIYQR